MIDFALRQLAKKTGTSIFEWQKIERGYIYAGKKEQPNEPLNKQPEQEIVDRQPLLKLPKQMGLPPRWV